ncbi:MAG: hypothetical protein Homavirus11_5 [Homavirus sp.]|uniref:Uncharacterized protein n=1 Tax=Homavirus sp. TaxID=2487769 RepID=A0A3G5A9Y4_9VIRU|nr:MAG: hypothetical protein Homavirus11_5 [Homavirus sp.]
MSNIYHNGYIHYKNKYLSIKYNGGYKKKSKEKYDFYVYHSFGELIYEKILCVLNDGYLKLGSDVEQKYRVYSGYESQPHIFANIYFPEIKNIKGFWGDGGLVLHPDVMYDYDVEFVKGWGGMPGTTIHKNDDNKTKKKKLQQIKKWVENPDYISEGLQKMLPSFHYHELIFNEKIPIKYIIGIICSYCPDNKINKIKNKLKKLNIDIPVYTDPYKIDLKYYQL